MATFRKISNKDGTTSWREDYYDPQGRRIKKRFKKRSEAEAYLAKVVTTIKEEKYEAIFEKKQETLIIFNELADQYTESSRFQKSFASFKNTIIPILRRAFGKKLLSKISYLDLETFRNRRRGEISKRGTPRSPARVNRELAVLKHMLNKAVEWGMLEVSPFKRGKSLMFKENNERLRFLTEEEVEPLLAACLPHLRPIVETALLTGMRAGELFSLRWDQIINGMIYLKDTKSNKPRQIPISERLEEVLREERRRHQLKSPYVFCNKDGKRFNDIRNSFKSACRKVGIVDFRFHDLRHTFASHLVMRGVGLRAVQELLGHCDMKLTMRYAHLAPGHLRDSVNVLNDLGGGKQGEGKFIGLDRRIKS
jgi:integrase